MLSKSASRIRFTLLCLTCIILACYLFFPKKETSLSPTQTEFKKISDIQHASHADYIFLQDTEGKEWIYKQIVEEAPDDQIVIVLESVAAEMAKAVKIPLNEVRLISANEVFPHSFLAGYPGSLHLKVQGKSVEDSSPWEDFDIHQKIRSAFLIARKGPLPPEEVGLRREVIQNMAKHPDLAKIVALDTYLGNNDRSNPNVFYDQTSNTFYGIDMGSCLIGNLAESAREKIQNFTTSDTPFSKQELVGLTHYSQALQSLLSTFPPKETIALLDHALKEAGFYPENPLLWNEDVERKVRKWKLAIEENYSSTKSLVTLLESMNGN